MGLFGIYMVKTRKGIRFMTAKKLCEKVIVESKQSNYNWSFSAEELVYNCDKPRFPKNYAKQIKICILVCFGNIERRRVYNSVRTPEDESAVKYCYNSMVKSKDEAEKLATKRYFKSILDNIIKYDSGSIRHPFHYGATYHQECDEWKKQMLDKYYTGKPIEDWDKLKNKLNVEFNKFINIPEKQKLFAEEDEKRLAYIFKKTIEVNKDGEEK